LPPGEPVPWPPLPPVATVPPASALLEFMEPPLLPPIGEPPELPLAAVCPAAPVVPPVWAPEPPAPPAWPPPTIGGGAEADWPQPAASSRTNGKAKTSERALFMFIASPQRIVCHEQKRQ
jgi:hypothetical protein